MEDQDTKQEREGGREGGRGPGSTAPPKPMQAPASLLGKPPLRQQLPWNLRQIPVTLSKKLSPPSGGRDGSELLRCRLQRVEVGGGDPGERSLLWLFCPHRCPPHLWFIFLSLLSSSLSPFLFPFCLLRKMAELVRLKIKRPHQLNTSERTFAFTSGSFYPVIQASYRKEGPGGGPLDVGDKNQS